MTHNVQITPHARDLHIPSLTEQEAFDYWQLRCEKPRAKFTRERREKVRARLAEKYTLDDIKQGCDGAALNPPRDRDSGVVHDDLVSICRNGAQLERYVARATAQPLRVVSGGKETASDWLRDDFIDGEPITDAQVVGEEAS